jgi:hypothetical protein
MKRRFILTICTTLALLAALFGAGPREAAAQTAPAGDAWAWGSNNTGQLGVGGTTNRTTPVPVSTLTNVTAIAGGAAHSLALRNDGAVWAWGNNLAGQLGDGSTTNRTTPVPVSTLTNVTAIAGGGLHSLALVVPRAALSPQSLAFGDQPVGTTSAAQPVTLSNSGGAPLTINSITASGDFAQTTDCSSSLAAGASCTINVTFTPTATGNRTGTLTINDDAAGNPHTVALSGMGTAPPDTTPPTITITAPTNTTYTPNQAVAAVYACSDSGSGVASCIGTVPSGSTIDTASVGTKTFTVNAADTVGNATTASVAYTVIYNFSGFFQPVDNLPVLNAVKAGSAIPVKFSLAGNQGLTILAAGYPKSQPIPCDSAAAVDDIEQTVTAGGSLAYDAASDQYSYVWKTDKAWAGGCRQLIVRLADGTDHRANFKFK